MKKYAATFAAVFLCLALQAQTEAFDIAHYTPLPKGWMKTDSNGMRFYQAYRTRNNQTSFCQLFLFPSRPSNSTPTQNFNQEWNTRVALPTGYTAAPATQTENTPDGWTVVSGSASINSPGLTYTCILVSITGFNKQMTALVNMAGTDFVKDVDAFFKSFELDNKTTMNNVTGPFDWSGYNFTPPDKWFVQKNKDHILLSQTQSMETGCVITILLPQPSSGNLETDAKNIFNIMYPGWQYRYTGEKHDDLSKGITPQGLEYCMIEAPMHKMRPDGYYYDYEDGAAWVIGMGKQVAVVSARHNRLLACFCNQQYESWRRFFNSFTIKNATPKSTGEDVSKRILGDWMAMGSGALTEYIFAANGHYQFIGAYGSSTKVTDTYNEYIYTKTSSFAGDGAYSIKGDQLSFGRRGDKDKEQVRFRFEKVNHGGTGWKERLYMLKTSAVDGRLYEVCYEKRR